MATRSGDPAALRLLTSNATHSVLGALAAAFERARGHAVRVDCDSAKRMLERIENGEAADVAVLNAPHVERLVASGRIVPRTCRVFSRSRVGVAVRAGAVHPDVSTVDAFIRTLRNARTVAHTVHGASGMYFPQLIDRLGIAEEIAPKCVTRPGGLIGRVVAAGEAELAVQQISELLAVPGIELVGPLPDALQRVFESRAGVFADSTQPAAAEALVGFLAGPLAASTLPQFGLEAPCVG
jgi:molybdate transport system substrate-binding protein